MVDFKIVWEKLKEGKGTSELRDERKASFQRKESIPEIKKGKAVQKRLFLITDFESYFNPLTGYPDEFYNEEKPFRPALAVSSVISQIKEEMAKNPELKERYMQMAGLSEYNPTSSKCNPSEDYPVFKQFLKFRIFSIPVLTINDPVLTGRPFGQQYLYDMEKDPETGEYLEESVALQISKWYSSISFSKVEYAKECWEKAKKGEPFDITSLDISKEVLSGADKLASLNEEEMKKVYSDLRKGNIVFGPSPLNYVLAYAIDLDQSTRDLSTETKTKLTSVSSSDLKGYWGRIKVTKEFKDNVLNDVDVVGRLKLNMDYVEVNMICPSNTDDKLTIGRDTRYKLPDSSVLTSTSNIGASILEAHEALCTETWETIDSVYRGSLSYVKKYTDATDTLLLGHFQQKVDLLSDAWATDKVISANMPLISLLYPEKADELAMTSTASKDAIKSMKRNIVSEEMEQANDTSMDLSELAEDREVDVLTLTI